MRLSIKKYITNIQFDGFLFTREYEFPNKQLFYKFIEGIKTQYFLNSPETYQSQCGLLEPNWKSNMSDDETIEEYMAYIDGIHEARGIYGFRVVRHGW